MNETELAELADQVASILGERDDKSVNALAVVGEVALIAGASYMVIKTVQRVRNRRWYRKFYPKNK
jgi:hypothetical protein